MTAKGDTGGRISGFIRQPDPSLQAWIETMDQNTVHAPTGDHATRAEPLDTTKDQKVRAAYARELGRTRPTWGLWLVAILIAVTAYFAKAELRSPTPEFQTLNRIGYLGSYTVDNDPYDADYEVLIYAGSTSYASLVTDARVESKANGRTEEPGYSQPGFTLFRNIPRRQEVIVAQNLSTCPMDLPVEVKRAVGLGRTLVISIPGPTPTLWQAVWLQMRDALHL